MAAGPLPDHILLVSGMDWNEGGENGDSLLLGRLHGPEGDEIGEDHEDDGHREEDDTDEAI